MTVHRSQRRLAGMLEPLMSVPYVSCLIYLGLRAPVNASKIKVRLMENIGIYG